MAIGTAAAMPALQGIRYHAGSQHDRMVFDFNELPCYRVEQQDAQTVLVDFDGVFAGKIVRKIERSNRIDFVEYTKEKGTFRARVHLKKGFTYKVAVLKNPVRIVFDVIPSAEKQNKAVVKKPELEKVDLAPGLWKYNYTQENEEGKVTAYFIEADPKYYTLRPILGNGKVLGRQRLSRISDDTQAVAAINASYFAQGGEILGLLKMDGEIVGTTEYQRSALGLLADGTPIFGKVSYAGTVQLGNVTQAVWGVDTERIENSLILYNHFYGATTRTNVYGKEYVIEGNRVTAIVGANARIPENGWVVSVHGAAAKAFENVKVGDTAIITQELGAPWNRAKHIIGVGPRLVENGRVHVTVAEEKFPADIRYGRAPRSAVAVTREGNYILGVVDGRQESSRGCTLTEWAELLMKIGAVNALNLDGGGSSELVVGGDILNSPSDGAERAVGSALILK